jgi:hypothetical protein
MSEKAFEENSSLSKEAERAYESFNSKVQLALNKLRNVGITIGNKLMPHVLRLIDGIESLLDRFKNLSDGAQNNIIKLAGIAAALGPAKFVMTKFTRVVSGTAGMLATLSGKLTTLPRMLVRARQAQRALNIAVRSNPYIAAASAIAAVGAAIAGYVMQTDKAKEKTTELEDASKKLNERFAEEAAGAKNLFAQLKNTNRGTKSRSELIKKINSKYGKYLENQISEKDNLKQIAAKRRKVIQGIRDEIALKITQEKRQKILKERLKEEQKFVNAAAEDLNNLSKSAIREAVDQYGRFTEAVHEKIKTGASEQKAIELVKKETDLNTKAIQTAENAYVKFNGEMKFGDEVLRELAKAKENANQKIKDLKASLGVTTDAVNNETQANQNATQEQQKQNAEIEKSLTKLEQEKNAIRGRNKAILETGKLSPFTEQSGRDGELEKEEADAAKTQAPTINEKEQKKTMQALNRALPKLDKVRIKQQAIANVTKAAGQGIGKMAGALGASFSAVITGQKSAGKAFANFGKQVGNILQQLIKQIITMLIKMLAFKAILGAIGGPLSGIGGGGIGGQLLQGIGGGFGQLVGGSGGPQQSGAANGLIARDDQLEAQRDFQKRKQTKTGQGG